MQSNLFIYPGKLEVATNPTQFTTILGSCVAVCLWDTKLKFGGINHFMLPLWNGEGLASPKYGNIAIDKLITKMIWAGASIENMEAKVFGGGNVINTTSNLYNIGERNIEMAFSKLNEYGIRVVGSSTGGKKGRKILMDSSNFKILHKFIEKQSF
ncbi:MAG TPA: chemotaxis protein CheD [Bacteroidales bacterium]|nr:chemotaxis protein CheD [Bacteroidales bacterium]